MVRKWDQEYTEGAHWEKEPSSFSKKFTQYISKGDKVLDAGCGSGRDSFYLAENGFNVSGVDISAVAIKRAKEEAKKRGLNINFNVGNLEKLEFKEETFDGIYSGYALQSTNLKKVSKELARVLKTGKIAFVVMFEKIVYDNPKIPKELLDHDFILNHFSKYFKIEKEFVDEYSEEDQRGNHAHKRLVLILKKIFPTNVKVKTIKNKGKGIFALKDFKKGEHILDITGEVIETENPLDYPEEIREHWGPMGKKGNKFRFIKPEEPWMYMNHSCDSNAGIIDDRKLIASRDIKKGEEITVDYSTLDIESLTQGKEQLVMKCKCGSKNCRKIISTFDRLNKKDQNRLKKFLNSYLKKKYFGKKKD